MISMRHVMMRPSIAGLCLTAVLTSCKPTVPSPSTSPDAPQVAVSQAWQKLSQESIFSPTVDTINEDAVCHRFWELLDPDNTLTTKAAKAKWTPEKFRFRSLVEGKRFDELEALVKLVKKPSDAPRWHVYGAWINAVAQSIDHRAMFYPPSRQEAVTQFFSAHAEGAGLELRSTAGGRLVVASIDVYGPSAQKNVHVGDRVIALRDGLTETRWIDTSHISSYEAMEWIKGKPGTNLGLRLERNGTIHEIDMVRGRWSLSDALVSSKVVMLAGTKTMIISVPRFYADQDPKSRWSISTSQDIAAALKNAHSMPVVLDLRNNPGGLLEEARSIVGSLGVKGVAWTVKTKEGVEHKEMANGDTIHKPILIWVNAITASSAEILAGALHRVGVPVLGTPTFGKSSIQLAVPLDHLSFLHHGASRTGMLLFSTGMVVWDRHHSVDHPVTPDCVIKHVPGKSDDLVYMDASEHCSQKRSK